MVCLANVERVNPSALVQNVVDIVLEGRFTEAAPAEPPPGAALAVSPEELEPYAGAYVQPDSGMIAELQAVEGVLTATAGPMSCELTLIGPNRFRSADASLRLDAEFERQPGARVTALTISFPGRPGQRFDAVEPVAYSPAELAEFAGEYWSDELQTAYRVGPRDGALIFRFRHSGDLPAKSAQRDQFAVGPGAVTFARDGRGRVTGFTLSTDRARGMRFGKKAG